MKGTLIGTVVLCGLLGLGLAGIAFANSAVDGDEPAIMVSPSTVVLAKVDSITVHTNIPAIVVGSVDLNGVVPTGVWADNCGHIVARFGVADLDLEPGRAELTLTLEFADGGGFSGTDWVTVK